MIQLLTVNELKLLLLQQPSACAEIKGSMSHPNLSGLANFYETSEGVLVLVRGKGLPFDAQSCGPTFFGMHIHEGASCTGTNSDPFSDTGSHFNPHNCDHPMHVGDLSSLIGNHGDALMLVETSGFTVEELIGRTIVVHARQDDFMTQPTGNSDDGIGCGVIVKGTCLSGNLFFG